MAVDKFQDCFCGCGQKIKYCAPKELLGEIDALQRQMEGEQFNSAWRKIEQLEQKFGPQSTLLALKCDIGSRQRSPEKALAASREFVEKFPDNPHAHAWRSVAESMSGNWDLAMSYLQHALERTTKITNPMMVAFQFVQATAPAYEHYAASCAMAEAFAQLAPGAHTTETLVQARQMEVPLPLKHVIDLPALDNDAPWAAAVKPAADDIRKLRWRRALTTLASVSRQHPKDARLKRLVARLMMELGSPAEKIAEQFRQLASTPGLTYAEQVEAHIYRLAHQPPEDPREVVTASFEIDDANAWLELFSASKQFLPQQVERSPDDDSPPPKAVFLVLDREPPEKSDDVRQWARILGGLSLYGKQTDRAARLQFMGARADLEVARTLLQSLRSLGEPAEEPEVMQTSSELLAIPMLAPVTETDLPQEDVARNVLVSHYTETLAERTFAGLGGKTIAEAAQDPLWQPVLEAYLSSLELETSVPLAALRQQLGLPALEVAVDEENAPPPLVLAAHLHLAGLSDRMLEYLLVMSTTYGISLVTPRLLEEACRRENANHEIRYQTLRQAAMFVGGETGLAALAQAVQWCEAQGGSPGMLHVDRFLTALGLEDSEVAQEAFQQAVRYADQPEVAARLQSIMQRLEQLQRMATQSAAPAEAAGGGLWTPDSGPSAAASPLPGTAGPGPVAEGPAPGEAAKSKLWLPGQD